MRLAPAVAAVPLLAACAHAGTLAPLLPNDGPHGIVSIETRPSGARVVLERGGARYLACRKTPCSFEAPPGQGRIEMRKFLYRYQSDIEVGADEEARYVVELQGGYRNYPASAFWSGMLGLVAFVPGTIMSIRERDAAWAGTFGVLAAASATVVFAPLVWPSQAGGIVSQERRRIDAREGVGDKEDEHGSDGGDTSANDPGAGRVTSDGATPLRESRASRQCQIH